MTGICLNVNPERPGSAYGYVDMGGWPGGQADYVMVPFRGLQPPAVPRQGPGDGEDPGPHHALGHLPDRLPRRHLAGVTTGSTVYVAGAGPVGLAAAHSAQLLGAAVVIVGDAIEDRLKQAESFGCVPLDITQDAAIEDQIAEIMGEPIVDCTVDAVGFEARGHGSGEGRPRPRCSTTR
jgi:glutathione-independent formaldehyde dehydrogenase